jgi:hypothetical protein
MSCPCPGIVQAVKTGVADRKNEGYYNILKLSCVLGKTD